MNGLTHVRGSCCCHVKAIVP